MIKKIISGLLFFSISLLAEESALNYIQNYNQSILVKEMAKKINNISSSIGTYIVNSGGIPSYSGGKLSLGFTKEQMSISTNLYKEDLYKLDGSSCTPISGNTEFCNNGTGIIYNFVYDKNNTIPIGIKFTHADLFGTSTSLVVDDKILAYLNTNGIVKNDKEEYVKYFNNTTMSTIKQEYFILKNNSNIKIIDTSIELAKKFIGQTIYSPDGKGGFLIYTPTLDTTTNEYIWKAIGEPSITLTVKDTSQLEGLVVPSGQTVTVLNDGGRAIEYTMQESKSNGAGTASAVWNKTSGAYEKNYYFNPIKITSISLGVSAELQKALGNWDSHTFLKDTFIDNILYDPVYVFERDSLGNIKKDISGNYIYKLDEGGQKIMEAQSLSSIIGHIKYDGGLATGGITYSYEGRYHSSNVFGNKGGRLYFEILANEMKSSSYVNWIGNSVNINISANDREPAYYCPWNFGLNGALIYRCDVWISFNRQISLQGFWINDYKNTGIKIYKSPNAIDYANSKKIVYDNALINYNKCITSVRSFYGNSYYDYLCNNYQTIMNEAAVISNCLKNGTCNTQFACHHDTDQCVFMPIQTVTGKLNDSEFNMKLGCEEDSRITYNDNVKMILKNPGEKVDVNVLPYKGNHKITYKKLDGIKDYSFISNDFNLTYITTDTFGALKCIKRNASSNYGKN